MYNSQQTIPPSSPKPKQPLSLQEASGFIAHKLQAAIGIERPTLRGRRSTVARELYVRGAAAALDITVTHMSRIITGRSRPGMQLARKIAELAGCSVDDILSISEARERQETFQPN